MQTSIIICTCNRADSLQQTLQSLAETDVPVDQPCEVIVVDNGSADGTRALVEDLTIDRLPLRYVHEGRRGLSHARNTGIAAAEGDVILFTDDDVRVPPDWIAEMTRPLRSGEAHAVTGRVKMAPHLERAWMDPVHRVFLADTDTINVEAPERMVGANMAFSREVLSKVCGFDTELGAGTLCRGEETLFSRQLMIAGYRLVGAFHVSVEHHFQEARLTRDSFLDTAEKCGAGDAYFAHHWEHRMIPDARLRLLRKKLQLDAQRLRNRNRVPQEGISVMEMCNLCSYYFYERYLAEKAKPRKYEKHGLTKLGEHDHCLQGRETH